MPSFAQPPILPMRIQFDSSTAHMNPAGPVLTRRLSDLEGLFADQAAWLAVTASQDRVVYDVHSSPVPETPRELPQSITTIAPGDIAGELFMTKGHQHPDPQAEIYLGPDGDGRPAPVWRTALRVGEHGSRGDRLHPSRLGAPSVNVSAEEPYRFLAVYPGSAGHDYQWVLDHGMGARARRLDDAFELVPFGSLSGQG